MASRSVSHAPPYAAGSSRTLAGLVPRGRLVAYAAISLLVALSEGIGIVLLVPLLGSLGRTGAAPSGPLARVLSLLPPAPGLAAMLALFVVLVVVRAALQFARLTEGTRLQRIAVRRLRRRAVAALIRADLRQSGQWRQAEVTSLLVNESERIALGIGDLAGAFAALATLGIAFAAALLLSPLVALTALAGGAAVVAAYASSRRRSLAHGTMLTALNAELHQQLADTLGALRLIKSFGAQDRSLAALDAIEREAADERVAHQAMVARGQALLLVAGAILAAVLVWLGIRQWHTAPIVLLPLIALFARVLPLLDGLQAHWQSWRAAQPALGATLALIGAAEDADETADVAARTAPAPDREIALKGVSLRHAGRARPALDRVDLVLPLGSATVLAGASGAGKSSVADILGGLIQPDTGALTLDGRALDPAERVAWRERVAYVQQEPILFHATIRQNLVWAVPDADETRMVAALRGAAAGFVLDLPLGLDTVVGEAGRQLSGGERQRIVLARALLREPVLMILDEAASSLDPASEAEIAAAVSDMRGRITLLIIGHRGALTALADRQAHLAEGRISTTDAKVAAA